MRKLLLLIAFLPLIAAIGHDVYNFTQNQEKGFRFADVGWIWAKYDPKSHRQVNEELNTLIEQGEAGKTPVVTAEPVEEEQETQKKAPDGAAPPEGAQTQRAGPDSTRRQPEAEPVDDGTAKIRVTVQKNASNLPSTDEIAGNAAGFVAFVMQQKAVVVGACWTVLLLVLMRLFGAVKLGGKKDFDDLDAVLGKKKSGGYKFNRK